MATVGVALASEGSEPYQPALTDNVWETLSPQEGRPLIIDAFPQDEARVLVGVKGTSFPRTVIANGPAHIREDGAHAVNVGLQAWKDGDRFTGRGNVLVGLDTMNMDAMDIVSGWMSDWESTVDDSVPRLGGVAVLGPDARGTVILDASSTTPSTPKTPEPPKTPTTHWFLDKGMALVVTKDASFSHSVVLAPGSVVLVADPTNEEKTYLGLAKPELENPVPEDPATYRTATLWKTADLDPSVLKTPVWVQRQALDGTAGTAWLEGEWVATPTGWAVQIKKARRYPAYWRAFIEAASEPGLPNYVRHDMNILTQVKEGIRHVEHTWDAALDDRYVGTLAAWPLGLSALKTPMQITGVRERFKPWLAYEVAGSFVLTDFQSRFGEVGVQWTKTTLDKGVGEDARFRARLTSLGAWMGSRQANLRMGLGVRRESGHVRSSVRMFSIADWRARVSLPWRAWEVSGILDWEEDTIADHYWYGGLTWAVRHVAGAQAPWREGRVRLGQWVRDPMWTSTLKLEAGHTWRFAWDTDEFEASLGAVAQYSLRWGGKKHLVTQTGTWTAAQKTREPQFGIKGVLHAPIWGGWIDAQVEAGMMGSTPWWRNQLQWSYKF